MEYGPRALLGITPELRAGVSHMHYGCGPRQFSRSSPPKPSASKCFYYNKELNKGKKFINRSEMLITIDLLQKLGVGVHA